MACLLKQDRSRLHGAECRQTRNGELQPNSGLLWLAVPGCYFAGHPIKKPALPRLRQTRWLLFCCIISEISERWGADCSRTNTPGNYVAAILSGATRGAGFLASRLLLISSIDRPLVSMPRNAKTRPAWPYRTSRNSRAGKIASSVTLGLTELDEPTISARPSGPMILPSMP